jgi:alpha-aminoadipate carrier protein LysW
MGDNFKNSIAIVQDGEGIFIGKDKEEAAMTSCPECENELDLELDEVAEGDVVACDECGTEFEVVAVEPLELARVDGDEDEDEDEYSEEEEEEDE